MICASIPLQQVDFLDRLRRGVLPESPRRSQDLVRDILPVTQVGDAVIRAKSGLLGAERDQPSLGWMVGWAEKGEARAVFALNMDCKEPRHIASRMLDAGLPSRVSARSNPARCWR